MVGGKVQFHTHDVEILGFTITPAMSAINETQVQMHRCSLNSRQPDIYQYVLAYLRMGL